MDYLLPTITFENEKGFANHIEVTHSLKYNKYFPRPYNNQDNGIVENRNGRIM
jgi:IS30 family transposase